MPLRVVEEVAAPVVVVREVVSEPVANAPQEEVAATVTVRVLPRPVVSQPRSTAPRRTPQRPATPSGQMGLFESLFAEAPALLEAA